MDSHSSRQNSQMESYFFHHAPAHYAKVCIDYLIAKRLKLFDDPATFYCPKRDEEHLRVYDITILNKMWQMWYCKTF